MNEEIKPPEAKPPEVRPLDLLVTICSHRTLSAPTVASLNQLRLAELMRKLNFTYDLALFVGDALISRSRSQACTKFLEQTQIPYMLFIDDDIIFTPEDVSKIYNHLKSGEYDLIGGIYPVRGASQLSSYGWGGKLEINNQIQEIEFLATGFMGISRRLLEKMVKELSLPLLNANDWSRCYPFFEAKRVLAEERERGGEPIYISEDWDFVQKARKIGYKVFVDTSVQVGHMREEVFTCDNVMQKQSIAQTRKTVYGAMEHQHELMKNIDLDLSEFLKMPLSEVHRRLNTAQGDLAEEWHKKQKTTPDFYKDNQTYLFDLAMFNRTEQYFQYRLSALVGRSNLKILDIGCGIGTAVFMLAEQDNEVVGWDINQKCIDFCRFKKQKYNLKGEFSTEKPDLSQFDLVVAIDTLEHIEDLKEFLFELGQTLKSGAKFYHSDYFPKDNVWPMHFEQHAINIGRFLHEANLREWDAQWTIKP